MAEVSGRLFGDLLTKQQRYQPATTIVMLTLEAQERISSDFNFFFVRNFCVAKKVLKF